MTTGENSAIVIHPSSLAIKNLSDSGYCYLDSLLNLIHVFKNRIKNIVDIKCTLSGSKIFDGRVAADREKPK